MSSNLAYQDDCQWEELIDGKIVAMSPRPVINHNTISTNIYIIFRNYLHEKKCTAFSDGVDLYLTENDRFVPDMMVVCDRTKIQWDGVHGAPDLVVEVLSPSTAKYDRGKKKEVYGRCGVREYWIVDPMGRNIEQYLLRDGTLELHDIYHDYKEYELTKFTPEERAQIVTRFRCSLFDDLEIDLEEVFEDLLPIPAD